MYPSYGATTSTTNYSNQALIEFIHILVVVCVYLYLRSKVKNNESFSGLGWGLFAGIFMGGLGDLIFYALMSSILSKQLSEQNAGKTKSKQKANIDTVNSLKRSLGTGLAIAFVINIILITIIYIR